MRLTESIHAREIDAPPEAVGEILDSLGSAHDRIWPTELWPTAPLELDRPLGVGADGGHGRIRYWVEAYEPGRRVDFRLHPETGIDGVHGLRLEPLADGGTRLVHSLAATPAPWMRPFTGALLGMHDTMVETVLDRAESEATGRNVTPTRWPAWVRAANATEIATSRWFGALPGEPARPGRRGRRLRGPSAIAVSATLAALAALHAAWARGSSWPARDRATLAEHVISTETLPPDWATWSVAGMLALASGSVAAVGAGRRGRAIRALAWITATALSARGAALPPVDLAGGLRTPLRRLDLGVYSPLCLALGLGTRELLLDPGLTPNASAPSGSSSARS